MKSPSSRTVVQVGTLAANAAGLVEHNDSTGWQQQIQLPNGLAAVWGFQDVRLAAGLNGQIYKMTSVRPWYALLTVAKNPYVADSPFAPILYSIWGNNPNMFLVAADLDMTVNYFGNSMWIPLYDPVDRTRAYHSVWGPPSATPILYYGANYFGVWQFTGKNTPSLLLHEERDRPADANLYVQGIFGFASDRVIFVGDEGRIMTFDGGPSGLKTVPSPTSRSLYGVWGSSPTDIWIVGDDALIMHGSITTF